MLGWNLGKRLWSKSLLKKRTRFPVEGVLLPGREQGWRAATAGTQIIRLLFDRPQTIRTIRLLFKEYEVARAQEFVLRWLPHGTRSWKDVVRQQRNFSPSQAVEECEEYHVDLAWAAALELSSSRTGGSVTWGPGDSAVAENLPRTRGRYCFWVPPLAIIWV